jgi:4-carboxymuconolactone decarboxylase
MEIIMVDLPSQPLAELDLRFERIALETGSSTYQIPGTSTREKLFQCLADDICRGHLGLAYEMHIRAALSYEVPIEDIVALIRFMGPFAGYPASADALARAVEAASALGLADHDPQADHAGTGPLPELPPLDGPAPRETSADDWLAGFVESRTGRAWQEERLSPRERCLLLLTADVAQQVGPEALRHDVQLALSCGVPSDDIRDALRFTAEFGIDRADVALRAFHAMDLGAGGA